MRCSYRRPRADENQHPLQSVVFDALEVRYLDYIPRVPYSELPWIKKKGSLAPAL
jgi:hypothetical protein